MIIQLLNLEKEFRSSMQLDRGYFKDKAINIKDCRSLKYDFHKAKGMIRVSTINSLKVSIDSNERKSGDYTRYITKQFGYILVVDTYGRGKYQNEEICISIYEEHNRIDILSNEYNQERENKGSYLTNYIQSSKRIVIE